MKQFIFDKFLRYNLMSKHQNQLETPFTMRMAFWWFGTSSPDQRPANLKTAEALRHGCSRSRSARVPRAKAFDAWCVWLPVVWVMTNPNYNVPSSCLEIGVDDQYILRKCRILLLLRISAMYQKESKNNPKHVYQAAEHFSHIYAYIHNVIIIHIVHMCSTIDMHDRCMYCINVRTYMQTNITSSLKSAIFLDPGALPQQISDFSKRFYRWETTPSSFFRQEMPRRKRSSLFPRKRGGVGWCWHPTM